MSEPTAASALTAREELDAFLELHETCPLHESSTERRTHVAYHGPLRLGASTLNDGTVVVITYCVACEASLCRRFPPRAGWPPEWVTESFIKGALATLDFPQQQH